MNQAIRISPQIAQELAQGTPLVALESALITHGFAPPSNLEIARQMQAIVRKQQACPATIAIVDGQPQVGLSDEELTRLASDRAAHKVSLRDLPLTAARSGNGGTTVGATIYLAHQVGIPVFATGGIGGVHRGHPEDVSADLPALASVPIIVVCAGAKAILDLPRTLEYLETHGVPVIGYSTDEFPAFYSRRSGLNLKVDTRVETPEEVAWIARQRTELGLSSALLVCAPVPAPDELAVDKAEAAIAQAVAEAERRGIRGKALTPFLLSQLVQQTGGQARQANEALLLNNAHIAARIARALIAASK